MGDSTKPGERLLGGRYQLGALLAEGGMGRVHAGRHASTGREVAIKLLRRELIGRRDIVQRVEREARLAVEARHPNVVEVIDAALDDDGVPYVVLERLYGTSLDVHLCQPLGLLPAAQALVPIMNALAALHRSGIVHRDIKPSNIFLSCESDGRVRPKLLDFGIAKALQASPSACTGTPLGTPLFMAPEQALGSATLGPPADVWAMAVVFVRALTGNPPFGDRGASADKALQGTLTADDLRGVPLALAQVLVKALSVEPGARHANMAEFRAATLNSLGHISALTPWPDATTIAYAPHETALASWARPIGSGGATLSTPPLREGRVAGQLTRTWRGPQVPGALDAPHSTRWRLGVAAIAAGGVLVALSLRAARPGAVPPTEPIELSAQSAAEAARRPAPSDTAAGPLEEPGASPALPSQRGREGPPLDVQRPVARQRTGPARAALAPAPLAPALPEPPDTSEPATQTHDLEPTAGPAERGAVEYVLGTNRAPIIE